MLYTCNFLTFSEKESRWQKREEGGSEKKVGGGQEDAVCDSIIHEVQFNVNYQMIS